MVFVRLPLFRAQFSEVISPGSYSTVFGILLFIDFQHEREEGQPLEKVRYIFLEFKLPNLEKALFSCSS